MIKRFLTILLLFFSVAALGQSAARKLLMAQGETEKWYKILDLDIYADEEVEGQVSIRSNYINYNFKTIITDNYGSIEYIEDGSNNYDEYITVDENTQKIEIYINDNEVAFSDLIIREMPLQYLDLSISYFVNSSFNLQNMPDLSDITFPQNTEYISYIWFINLGLTGELDLSWVEERFSNLFLRDLGITSLKFNENTNEISMSLILDRLDIEGVLDLTQFEIINQTLEITNMPSIEEILFYEDISSSLFGLSIFNTGINTDLDISMFDNFVENSYGIFIYDNKYAGEIIFPNSFGDGEFGSFSLSNNGTLAGTPSIPSSSVLNLFTKEKFDYNYITINISSMGWNATQVNQALQIIDNNSSSGYTGRRVEVGNNVAPTGVGVTAKSNLVNKGWIVITD